MFDRLERSIRAKLMVVVLATTFTALLISAAAMVFYDLSSYRENIVSDLTAQADIIARASAPALDFDDPKAAEENLGLLKLRPSILAGAIYAADGTVFASYFRNDQAPSSFPPTPSESIDVVSQDRIELFHRVEERGQPIGMVYLRAEYKLRTRLADYLNILAVVSVIALLIASAISLRLQRTITNPILSVTDAARQVMSQRDFSRRANKTTEDEIGVLVDAFNGMLSEVGQRTAALETSHSELQREMGERRQAEEALREADQRKDEFLATLAHELRNPLAPIQTSLEIVRAVGSDSEPGKASLAIMARQLKQLVRLVDDLLDVSRITTGKLIVRKEVIELQAVARNAVETVRPLIESRNHALTLALPDEPVFVRGDSVRLAQVLANLLHNAAKFTDMGGKLALTTRLEDNSVVITISDNGIGIPQEVMSSIFGLFQQGDQSLERTHGGLGVGLSLARRLVELHGGTLTGYSDGAGTGSSFLIRLPTVSDAQVAPASPPTPTEPPAKLRILLADDNRDFISSMAELLRQKGHVVQTAFDGLHAQAVAPSFRPDVAFLDIGMPGMNGYQLASVLKANVTTAQCVVVAVTGWGQASDRQRATEAGFDHHLVKPVDFAQMETILAGVTPRSASSPTV